MCKISGMALAVAATAAVMAGPIAASAAAAPVMRYLSIEHGGGYCGSYHGKSVYCSY